MVKIILILIILNVSDLYSQSGWFHQKTGTQNRLSNVFFLNENTGWAAGDSGTIIRTVNGGADWDLQISNTNIALEKIAFTDSLNGTAIGTYYEYNPWCFDFIIRLTTSDGGNTWIIAEQGYSTMLMDFSYSENVFFASFEGTDCWQTIGAVSKSTDSGLNWTSVNQGFGGYAYKSAHFINTHTGWALGYKATDFGLRVYHLIKTTSGGADWDYIRQDTGYNYLSYWGSKIRFINQNTGYLMGNNYRNLKKTTDGGYTWYQTDSNITSGKSDYCFINPDTGWIIGGGTIIRTNDGGNSWSSQNSGVTGGLHSIFFVNENVGFIAGNNGLMLKTYTGGLTNLNTAEQYFPADFELYQNYPNPFNPATIISFSLPHGSYVNLKVFDAAGRKIKELINEYRQRGSYEVKFDGIDFASGVYFYRLAADDYSAVRRMILLK